MNWNAKRLLRSDLVHNVLALYGVQACTYLLPVLTFPYLARVLGPSGWGVVVFSQGIGSVIAIFVEYGFDLSATRETSRCSQDKGKLSELISGVLGAKVILAALGICGALASRPFTHHIAPSLVLFWASTLWGCCQGINMLWYFQGLERMRLASALEIIGKVLATLSIFALVHKPEDGWKVLAAQGIGCLVAHGITVVLAYREVGFRWPRPALVWEALHMGWSMFLFRAAHGLSTTVNGLVLGFFAPAAAVGTYAGAERITRVFQQGLWPVNQALYPRLSQQVKNSPDAALRTVRLSLMLLGSLGLAFGAFIFFAAPILVHVILGRAFNSSIPTLQAFAFWIPLTALCTVLSFQSLLPNRMDNQFNFVVFTAGLLNVGVSILLAPHLSSLGMAIAAVAAQAYTLAAFYVILHRAHLNPFVQPKSLAVRTVA